MWPLIGCDIFIRHKSAALLSFSCRRVEPRSLQAVPFLGQLVLYIPPLFISCLSLYLPPLSFFHSHISYPLSTSPFTIHYPVMKSQGLCHQEIKKRPIQRQPLQPAIATIKTRQSAIGNRHLIMGPLQMNNKGHVNSLTIGFIKCVCAN